MFKKRPTHLISFLFILSSGLLVINLIPSKATQSSVALGAPAMSGAVDANVYVNLSKKLLPSVVNISTVSTVKSPFVQGSPDDILRKFFGDFFRQYNSGERDGEDDDSPQLPPQGRGQRFPKAMALGTGFIIDSSGLILTNNHVVANADEIKISFTESRDEKPSDAEVVGRDPEIDIALIKVKAKKDLIPVALGDSDNLEVGEYVMAVGNPFGQGHSVTHGIISAKGRIAPDFPLATYLQTDAPINPGNSGGPLVNLKGEVIGINNAIDQRAQGIGFAIPISLVKKVLPQLRTKGIVARGYIGVLVETLTPELAKKIGIPNEMDGPIVSHVYPGEPADKAGLKPYDVILEFNGKPVHSGNDLIAGVTGVNVGDAAPIKISRNGKEKLLTIKVGQRPGAQQFAEKVESKKKNKTARIETGMSLEDLTPQVAQELGLSNKMTGVVVSNISYGGPADKAGLARGDLILEADRKSIKNVDSFYNIVKEQKSYLLRVRRTDPQGNELFSVIVLDLKS